MPELPEVETVCQGLRQRVLGKTIAHVVLHRTAIRFPIPPEIEFGVAQQKIIRIDRHSKYILLVLEDGGRVLVHLGMTGKLFYLADDAYQAVKHDHVIFHFIDGQGVLVFNDARRFGVIDYLSPQQKQHKLLDVLGIDPLSDALTPTFLLEKFARKNVSMKNALMDQRLIAGLGNIYVCEALFRARIHPQRIAHTITRNEAKKLRQAIIDVLQDALHAGGSSLRDYVDVDGDQGLFQHQFQVYGREHQACVSCATQIERFVQSGRSSFACPRCQK